MSMLPGHAGYCMEVNLYPCRLVIVDYNVLGMCICVYLTSACEETYLQCVCCQTVQVRWWLTCVMLSWLCVASCMSTHTQ